MEVIYSSYCLHFLTPSGAIALQLMHIDLTFAVVPRNLEFEDDQRAHQQSQLQILRSAYQDIVDIMTRIHNTFSNDGPEVGAVAVCCHSFSIDCL